MKQKTAVSIMLASLLLIMTMCLGMILMASTAPATPPDVFQVASIDSHRGNVEVYRIRVNQSSPPAYIYLAVSGASTTVALTNRASSEDK